MRKLVANVAVLALLAGGAWAVEGEVNLDVVSAYVSQGETLNDGFVLQPSLEISGFPVPLSVGVWANLDLDDYDGKWVKREFSEVDFFLSYAVPVEEMGEMSLSYAEYVYPGSEDPADRKVILGLVFDGTLAPSLTAEYGLDGGVKKDLYVEAGIEHSYEVDDLTFTAGATVGYKKPDDNNQKDGFSHYTSYLGVSYGIIGLTGTYIGQIDDEVLSDDEYDVEFVGMLSVNYAF